MHRNTIIIIIAVLLIISLVGFLLRPRKPAVVAIGDSNTEQLDLPSHARWVNILAKRFPKYALINKGRAGENSSSGFLRMNRDVLRRKPNKAIVMYGSNDVKPKGSGSEVDEIKFEENISKMISLIEGASATPILMTVIPMIEGNGADGYHYSRINRTFYAHCGGVKNCINSYNGIVRGIARKRNVQLIDSWEIFVKTAGGDSDGNLIASGLIDSSGVHMTEKGSALLAEEIGKVLNLK